MSHNFPSRRFFLAQLICLLLGAALAVALQANESQAHPVPVQREGSDSKSGREAGMTGELPVAAQPRDARSSDDSRGCKRAARSGS